MAESKAKTGVVDDPMKLVKVTYPKLRGTDAPKTKEAWLNGKHYVIELGKEVQIPLAVKEIFDHSEEMMDEIEAFDKENATI